MPQVTLLLLSDQQSETLTDLIYSDYKTVGILNKRRWDTEIFGNCA